MFIVQPESSNYRLHVSGYSGNASRDSFSAHNGRMFTTFDRDNDRYSPRNCAAHYNGAFWYFNCVVSDCCVSVNGFLFYWRGLPGGDFLQSSRMWLQCK